METFWRNERWPRCFFPQPLWQAVQKLKYAGGWTYLSFLQGSGIKRGGGLCRAGVCGAKPAGSIEKRTSGNEPIGPGGPTGSAVAAAIFIHCPWACADQGSVLAPWARSGAAGRDCRQPGTGHDPVRLSRGRSGSDPVAGRYGTAVLCFSWIGTGKQAVCGGSGAAGQAATWETLAPAAGPMRPRAQSVPQGSKPPIRKTGAERRALTPRWLVR